MKLRDGGRLRLGFEMLRVVVFESVVCDHMRAIGGPDKVAWVRTGVARAGRTACVCGIWAGCDARNLLGCDRQRRDGKPGSDGFSGSAVCRGLGAAVAQGACFNWAQLVVGTRAQEQKRWRMSKITPR
jgi:hypothetical protein